MNDITTTPDNPPLMNRTFTEEKRVYNKRYYSDLKPAKGYTFEQALKAAESMGWEIVTKDKPRIEAVATTRWMRFQDDVVIEVRGDEVHVRSVSRTGTYDFGTNAKRIRAYLNVLKEADSRESPN